jgi:hypothetical protein
MTAGFIAVISCPQRISCRFYLKSHHASHFLAIAPFFAPNLPQRAKWKGQHSFIIIRLRPRRVVDVVVDDKVKFFVGEAPVLCKGCIFGKGLELIHLDWRQLKLPSAPFYSFLPAGPGPENTPYDHLVSLIREKYVRLIFGVV